ncbi:MAG TPA: hypothetical protein VIG32_09920 [Candidatus Baltobacteraceae bacterium]|jgi:hypothetical protein
MDHTIIVERTIAIVFGIVVLVTALVALKNDWKTPGLENHVFKVMLGLLALGGLLGTLAGIGIIGKA